MSPREEQRVSQGNERGNKRSAELAKKIRAVGTLAAALSRLGTACAFEVLPLGVGNSRSFEVTLRRDTEDLKGSPEQL